MRGTGAGPAGAKAMAVALMAASLMLILASAPGTAAGAEPVGFQTREVADPVTGRPVTVAVWYPAREAGPPVRIGPFTLAAARDVAPAPGSRPLILLSHGSGGSHMGHRDTALALAQAGMIAAAPLHAGDNFRDESLLGTPVLLESRARTISAIVTALLDGRALSIDPARIGFFGFSMGGSTGLALMGAPPAAAQISVHCRTRPDDPVCRWDPGGPDAPAPIPGLGDARIAAAVIAAPNTAHFSDDALDQLRGPILLLSATQDTEIVARHHTDRVAARAAVAGRWAMAGAGHLSFLAPYPDALRAGAGPAAQDPPGFDRAVGHRAMNARIAAFFESAFAQPSD